MNTNMNWDMFEKVEIKKPRTGGRLRKRIGIDKNKSRICISKDIALEAKLEFGDRFDLYRIGKTFALKKAKAGVLKVKSNNGGFVIQSRNACIEILALNGGCYKSTAWVENDVIFFKPTVLKEGEE